MCTGDAVNSSMSSDLDRGSVVLRIAVEPSLSVGWGGAMKTLPSMTADSRGDVVGAKSSDVVVSVSVDEGVRTTYPSLALAQAVRLFG